MDRLAYMMGLEHRRMFDQAHRRMLDRMFGAGGGGGGAAVDGSYHETNTNTIFADESDVDPSIGTSQDSRNKQPHVSRWSDEGELLRKEANYNKERGNKAFADKAYERAGTLYTDGLNNATKVRDNNEQVAVLFSNRSHVLFIMKKYQYSEDDAKRCIRCRPTWSKGYVRLMNALRGQEKYKDVVDVAVNGITIVGLANDDQLQIFTELLKILPDSIAHDISSFKHLTIPNGMWMRAFHKLRSQKEWKTIAFLILGRGDFPPLLPQECYKTADLKLSDLVTSCSVDDWKSWGQRSTIKLLQVGARMDELSPDGKAAAHAALRVGIRTGVYDLLKHLFLRYIPMGDRDRSDDNGDTLLHLACSETFSTKLTAVKLLLEHKVNPTCRNNANKRPLDLLAEDDPERASIIQAMEDKGYEKSCLLEAPAVAKEISKTQGISLKCTSADDTTVKSSCQIEADQVSASAASSQDPEEQEQSSLLSKIYHGSSSRCHIWTRSEVERWITDNNLTEIEEKLSGLCGPQLSELRLIQLNTPAVFYQLLYDHLHLSLTQLLKVSAAVRDLH